MKKFGQIIVMTAATGATALALAGGASAATGDDGPAFADPGVVVATGGLNSGPTSHNIERTGSFGTTRPSLMAKFGNGKDVTCPGTIDGTDAMGSKGLGPAAGMIFGGACG